ncbi:hypothetical protein C8Q77DRAFT_705992 [Trametes polyzona]|nr:hypothetical protein C8Q77DRAFT_705992 [Trametes polyzona]
MRPRLAISSTVRMRCIKHVGIIFSGYCTEWPIAPQAWLVRILRRRDRMVKVDDHRFVTREEEHIAEAVDICVLHVCAAHAAGRTHKEISTIECDLPCEAVTVGRYSMTSAAASELVSKTGLDHKGSCPSANVPADRAQRVAAMTPYKLVGESSSQPSHWGTPPAAHAP